MSLWLAIVLPALPLQLAARALEAAAPMVIVEGPAQRLQVAFCNDAARRAGIAPGSPLAAAQALAGGLLAVERKCERERDALAELAGWAYQFSGTIGVRDEGLLLETGGSLRLFGGRACLHRHIAGQLQALGYRAVLGEAATPQAAWWLAQARAQGLAVATPLALEPLHGALAPLPLTMLQWPSDTVDTLHALGLRTVRDLLALPRAAVNKRFGTALLADIDRALGHAPDPQPTFTPPERFTATIDLPADVVDTAQLMFPAQRLLRSLEGFLRGRGAGTTELMFSTQHNPRRALTAPPTVIPLSLAAPERDAERLAQLLAERLSRVSLPEPAVALTLTVAQLRPFVAANASFLPPAPSAQPGLGWLQLAETLHARLGSARVFQLQAVDDHRPEYAWRAVPIAVDETGRTAPAHATAQRPLLIVPQPQPLSDRADADEPPHYGGALRLIAGPERIDSGWWDLGRPTHRAVFRDYFVARNPRGQTLWIYRDLAAPRGWYLHGFFA